jgi:hypothetical protein
MGLLLPHLPPPPFQYKMPPQKAYSFTLNNYTQDELAAIRGVLTDSASYAIIGREVGEQGTPHLQGYVRFTKPYRFSTITGKYLIRCHVEVSRGSARQNRTYCSKSGDFEEFGTLPPEGKATRDDLALRFAASASDGRGGIARFAEEQPAAWYFSGHNLLRNYWCLQTPPDRPSITALWLHGRPGVGKSRRAHEELPGAYIKDPRTKWWNGYLGEVDVIIDDFGKNGIDINHLLRWFDRYKCTVENKGGMQPLHATRFIVTSNFSPEEVYTDNLLVPHPQTAALLRRLTVEELL